MNDADLIERLAILEARKSFWAYRQYINRNQKKAMKLGWWQRQIAQELEAWYADFIAGKRPKLVIESPPQHGKSHQIVDFISWIAGKDPDIKTIYTSFSERLGVRANLRLQRIYDSAKFQKIFPECKIASPSNKSEFGKGVRNTDFIEYLQREGSFRNTTVGGAITGESLSVAVLDDPIKGREAANSPKIRDKVWEWLTDDFFSRFSEEAGLIAILTRWHIDDPIGRLKAELGDKLKVISYPALATSNAKLMPNDPREIGSDEPLFPEHKSKEFLLERKAIYHSSSWEALYQQNPIIIGGEIIKGHEFKRYVIPTPIKYRIIYGDTAQKTKERNDFSVLECWGYSDEGIYLLDLIRGKWEAPELKQKTVDFWNKHKGISGVGTLRKLKIEDKASGTGLIQDIKRNNLIPIEGIERNKDKLTRVLDVVSYISAGKVFLPENAPYVSEFIAECEAFTADDSHLHDDQIDPMCDAINDMLLSKPKGFFS